jgi:subtilisin family serine protease
MLAFFVVVIGLAVVYYTRFDTLAPPPDASSLKLEKHKEDSQIKKRPVKVTRSERSPEQSATAESRTVQTAPDSPAQPTNSSSAASAATGKTVQTFDNNRSRSRVADWAQPKPGPLKAMKERHVNHLLEQNVIARKAWTDPSNRVVELTLVEDESSSRFRHYVIKHIKKSSDGLAGETYVQVANHLLVRFKSKPDQQQLSRFADEYSIALKKELLLPRSYLFTFQDVSLERLTQLETAIDRDQRVESLVMNSLTYPSAVPNDPLFDTLWGLQNNGMDPLDQLTFQADIDIQADSAWNDMTDCSQTVVAVLDTGVDPEHPDLAANVLADQGRDFTSNDQTDFIDRQGHGTHVSGTIGAVGNNELGVAGVCWQAAIIPVKVLGDDGTGTLASMLNGLMYVAGTDAKVLNLSLGGAPPTQEESDAIAANTDAGKLLVIAAGNENNDNDVNPAYPASYPNESIISVAALQGAGDLAEFSNFGVTQVDIAAPGQGIVSTIPVALAPNQDPAQAYAALSGTSMAAPHVAGAVALFWSYGPNLTPAQVKEELLGTSIPGNFTKDIAGSRMMDLAAFLDGVKAQANVQGLSDTQPISLKNSTRFNLPLEISEKYSTITKIEILQGDDVIAETSQAVDQIAIDLPLGFSTVELVTRVTDSENRVYTADPVELPVDVEKLLEFSDLDLEAIEGSVACDLKKIQAEGEENVIFSASVNSERTCQKLCDVIGPLAYSSLGDIRCASDQQTLYIKESAQ